MPDEVLPIVDAHQRYVPFDQRAVAVRVIKPRSSGVIGPSIEILLFLIVGACAAIYVLCVLGKEWFDRARTS